MDIQILVPLLGEMRVIMDIQILARLLGETLVILGIQILVITMLIITILRHLIIFVITPIHTIKRRFFFDEYYTFLPVSRFLS